MSVASLAEVRSTATAATTASAALPRTVSAAQVPALRLLPVPDTEPAPARPGEPGDPAGPGQTVLALPVPLGDDDVDEPESVVDADALPDPAAWAKRFATAAVEVAGGSRSPGQLVRWTSLEVHGLLARRGALATRTQLPRDPVLRRAVVRSVRVCRPSPGVCEAAAVVADRGRMRAVALRMEAAGDRWRVTALELG